MKTSDTQSCANVLGVEITPTDLDGAMNVIAMALSQQQKGYVCFTGVHGIMEAERDPDLRAIFTNSLMTAPDGMPTVWVGHLQGHTTMRQVTGPDLMMKVLKNPRFSDYTHFLYGGKEGIAQELQRALNTRCPAARIVGTYTPPFRSLTNEEEHQFIATIERLRPDMIWVGISTPRQEHFMHRMLPYLDTTLMFGVGAAFDFHTGRILDCPPWVKRVGLQWFHRLLQDPRHLWKRYLRNNPAFIWNMVLQLSGLRSYPPPLRQPTQTGEPAASAILLGKAGASR